MQGDQTTFILIVAVVLLLAFLAVWLVVRRKRTAHLRGRFGEEYDRTVEAHGRGDAERNLEEREKRVAEFAIRPLTLAERDRFAGEWSEVKLLFVDSPQEAVMRGDRLLGAMMETRGFPVANFETRYEDLTVDHPAVARHYREGREVAAKKDEATTEEMRRAVKNFEELYEELVRDAGSGPGDPSAAHTVPDGVTTTQTPFGRTVRPG